MRRVFFLLSTLLLLLFSQEVGCLSSIKSKDSKIECSSKNPLISNQKEISLEELIELQQKESKSLHRVDIAPNLSRVEVKFRGRVFTIERVDRRECPPFCIEPFEIKGIKGVGELETIEFIKSLDKKRGRILVDARSVSEFEDSTIPTAVNIPYSILNPDSKYKDEVLKLLGAVKLKKGWYFKKSYRLLIFDNGVLDSRARRLINRLIEYGYPKSKILYYRGGLESWRALGLSVI